MEPDDGRLTGDDVGKGRFPEVPTIVEFVESAYGQKADLLGRRLVITGGGTREPIDPVRYIGNRSSGKQAFYLAHEAVKRGAQVTMVMGPNALPRIEGVAYVEVETALEMESALRKIEKDFDVLIMTAAVADARPVTVERKKIKKEALGAILLEENPDLLHGAAKRRLPGQILVGFAAETTPEEGDLKELGAAKLKRKEVDLLFVNDVSGGAVFGSDRTGGFLMDAEGAVKKFTSIAKQDLARQLIDEIEKRLV